MKLNPNPLTSDEVLKWYDWFIDNTSTFEGIALELVYLWPAMLRGATIEVAEGSNLHKFLQSLKANEDLSELFDFIDVVGQEDRLRRKLTK